MHTKKRFSGTSWANDDTEQSGLKAFNPDIAAKSYFDVPELSGLLQDVQKINFVVLSFPVHPINLKLITPGIITGFTISKHDEKRGVLASLSRFNRRTFLMIPEMPNR